MNFIETLKRFFTKNIKVNLNNSSILLEHEFKCSFVELARIKGYISTKSIHFKVFVLSCFFVK